MAEDTRVAPDAEELRRLVATVLELPVEEVTDQADFVEELELDSLTSMELVIKLEKSYGIKVTDAEFGEMSCFADVRELVDAKLAAS